MLAASWTMKRDEQILLKKSLSQYYWWVGIVALGGGSIRWLIDQEDNGFPTPIFKPSLEQQRLLMDVIVNIFLVGVFLQGGIRILWGLFENKEKTKTSTALRFVSTAFCWTIALGVIAWYEQKTEAWLLYLSYVTIEVAYMLSLPKKPYYLCLIRGLQGPLLLYGCSRLMKETPVLPWYSSLLMSTLSFCFASTLFCVRYRIQVSGYWINPMEAPDDAKEYAECFGIMVSLLCLCFVSDENIRAFSLFTLWLHMAFLLTIWIEPRWACSLLCLDPKIVTKFNRVRFLAPEIWRYGSFLDILMFICQNIYGLLCVTVWNLRRADPNVDTSKFVFILGHPRSGTTNLHKSLHKHEDIACMTWSTALKIPYICSLFCYFVDTKNHRVTPNEEMEDHLMLMGQLASNGLIPILPGLADSPRFTEIIHIVTHFDEHDTAFLRNQMIQTYADSGCRFYVGRPFGYTRQPELLRRAFPGCKFILTTRDPVSCMASWTQLYAGISRQPLDNPRMKRTMRHLTRSDSELTFRAVAAMAKQPPPDVLVVSFTRWTTEPDVVIKEVLDFAGIESSNSSKLISPKTESHQKKKKAADMVEVSEAVVRLFDDIE